MFAFFLATLLHRNKSAFKFSDFESIATARAGRARVGKIKTTDYIAKCMIELKYEQSNK